MFWDDILGIRKMLSAGINNPSRIPEYLRQRSGSRVSKSLSIIKIREYLLQRELSNKDSKIELEKPWLKVKIHKCRNAQFIVKGKLKFSSWMEGNKPICIFLGENAILQIDGDFDIGSGVQIYVEMNGLLKIGGRFSESGSGITCDSKILVKRSVEIGKDFNCAWDVFITDFDWHYVEYDKNPAPIQADVTIGDHVWVAHGCSILKGTKIGNGSIVGSRSLLTGKIYPANSLLAGTPAKVIKNGCNWKRSIS
jgi:acetyltransferase-like isoleucine patch superfamily enzyme